MPDDHIFISYKRENRDFAEELRQQLQSWGYATWMDIYNVPKGGYWPDEIDKGLQGADLVVGVMSPQAVKSRAVKNEWDWAIINKRRLILLMIENCYVPMNYVSINYIDFTKNKAEGFEHLKEALVSSPTEETIDTDYEYLQKLFKRINTYLAQKIITRRSDDDSLPEPLRLHSKSLVGAVDSPFEEHNELDPLFAIGGIEQNEPTQIYNDFERAFKDYNGRVLLLGEPGAGKTITLLYFGRDAVVRRMQDASLPLPILGIIPSWLRGQQPFKQWLTSTYGAPKNAAQIIQRGKALLLLDGLDELGEVWEEYIEDSVDEDVINNRVLSRFDPRRRFMEIIPGKNQVVVTCRVKDYQEIGKKIALNGAVTLLPLDDKQMRAYLVEQPDLWAAVQTDGGLREMLRTPLLLSIFAFAYRDTSDEERRHLQDLTHSPHDLRDKIFETYVKKRYEHEERKLKARGETMPFTLNKIYEVLGRAGIANIRDFRRGILTESEADILAWYRIGKTLDDQEVQPFFQLMVLLHLLLPSKESGWEPSFRFIHLLLRDHFISTYSLSHLSIADSELPHIVRTLAWIRDSRAFEPLLAIFEKRQLEKNAQSAVIGYFAQLEDNRALPLLVAALSDEDAYIRSRTARALGKLDDTRAVQPLISSLRDKDAEVRSHVAQALGNLGDPSAVQSLIPLLADIEEVDEIRVCDTVAEALERIGTLEAQKAIVSWRQQIRDEK